MDKITRRDFIKTSSTATLGALLGASGLGGGGLGGGGLTQAQTDGLYLKLNPSGDQTVTQPASILKFVGPDGEYLRMVFGAVGPPDLRAGVLSSLNQVSLLSAEIIDLPPAGSAVVRYSPDPTNFNLTGIFSGYILIGDESQAGMFLNWSPYNIYNLGEGGIVLTDAVQGADVGLPTGTLGGAAKNLCYGDHRHAFTGRFFFCGFISDAALGALPVIWQRSIIANAITLRRITVDSLTPSTGIGNDTIRCGDGTSSLSVNLPAGGATATATGTVNIAAGATLRIEVSARNTSPAKLVNVAVDYTMNQ